MKKAGEHETVKTTIRLPKPLWLDARVRALETGADLQDLVAAALAAYLKTPVKRGRDGK
jgi:hypothetical protein